MNLEYDDECFPIEDMGVGKEGTYRNGNLLNDGIGLALDPAFWRIEEKVVWL